VGTYQYNPIGASWVFVGGSGLSANGSGFTSGNPGAPEGAQVAFLQTTGSFSQAFNWSAGSCTITFAAAKRGNNGGANDFQVLVDSTVVGTFCPTSTSYSDFSTTPVAVTAGAHTLKFVGLNSAGGDNTAFIDNARITISNGTPPAITTQPANATVNVGQTATFSVVASGTAPLSYQWFKNGTAISGATSASYTTPATVAGDNGAKFKVTVTNSVGSATSNDATLTVNIPTYTITATAGAGGSLTPSGTVTVNSGASQTFTIAANAGYQIAGVTVDGSSVGAVASYTFTNVTANHTIAASFSLVPVPTLTLVASKTNAKVGETFTVTVQLANAAPFASWAEFLRFDGTKLALVSQTAGTFGAFVADGRTLADINASGEVRAGGSGTVNNAGGAGTLGVFTFKALKLGATTISTENKSGSNTFGNVLVNAAGTQTLPQIAGGLTITVTGHNPGDLNGDNVVNIDDLILVTSHWGQTSTSPGWDARADANGDGVVNIDDLTEVTGNFGKSY
jgi:hypothetical protein